jgi:hypothetical protein
MNVKVGTFVLNLPCYIMASQLKKATLLAVLENIFDQQMSRISLKFQHFFLYMMVFGT